MSLIEKATGNDSQADTLYRKCHCLFQAWSDKFGRGDPKTMETLAEGDLDDLVMFWSR